MAAEVTTATWYRFVEFQPVLRPNWTGLTPCVLCWRRNFGWDYARAEKSLKTLLTSDISGQI